MIKTIEYLNKKTQATPTLLSKSGSMDIDIQSHRPLTIPAKKITHTAVKLREQCDLRTGYSNQPAPSVAVKAVSTAYSA